MPIIATDWVNGGLNEISKPVRAHTHAILFYSSLNTPKELNALFRDYRDYEEVLYVDMEDITVTDDIPSIRDDKFPMMIPTIAGVREIYDFIRINDSKDTNFLVSCAVGISRTGAIVDYLLSKGHDLIIGDVNNYSPNTTIMSLLSQLDKDYTPYSVIKEPK